MNAGDFRILADLLKSRSGLSLTEEKAYLLESRLMPVVRRRRMADLNELIAAVRRKSDEGLLTEVTEVMTTNESFFFRDSRPFEQFRDVVLPKLKESRNSRRHIRIWSAACSSGQEPYSLAMMLKDIEPSWQGWRIEIIATDISREILKKAETGIYSQFEVQRGLPIQSLMKYFSETDGGWQIDKSVRSIVNYKYFNLLDGMESLGTFDVVFCRNVLIYFDLATKADVLARIAKQMPEDGFLYLGGAETVLGISDRFRPMAGQRGLYELNTGEQRRAAG